MILRPIGIEGVWGIDKAGTTCRQVVYIASKWNTYVSRFSRDAVCDGRGPNNGFDQGFFFGFMKPICFSFLASILTLKSNLKEKIDEEAN